MLFLTYIYKILNQITFLWTKTLNVVVNTSKLLSREVKLLTYSLYLIITFSNSQSCKTGLSSFLTKKNYFLRDFVFFWKYFYRYHFTPKSNVKSATINSITKNTYQIITSNPFLFKVHNSSAIKGYDTNIFCIATFDWIKNIFVRSFGFGFYYIQGFIFVLFIDACLTDDEPLWEPIEWSLVQTWILFIFSFAWVAENLIVSRYGSYTGRDKRVWMSWYKTFWLIEGYYVINYGVAIVFVIIPFYFETNYNLSFVYSWWHWYSRVFFFKFLSLFTIILLIAYYLQMTVRWLNWKKGLILVLLVNIFLSYLIYTQFIITFLGFFTDPVWYQKTRPVDYIQLSHEPARWGWGSAKKDHFTYHNVKTVFWFKNDGPFAAAMIMFQTFLFVCIFFLYIYWISLFRRIWSMKEIPLTFTTYCVSSLRQFFYFALFFYLMIFMSYIINYSRLPAEFIWSIDNISWATNLGFIICDYPLFLYHIFF
jgi:hypothetical protein